MLIYIISYDIWFYLSRLMLRCNHEPINGKDAYISRYGESIIQGMGILVPVPFYFNTHSFLYALFFIHMRDLCQETWLVNNKHYTLEYCLDTILGTRNEF